MLRFTTLGTATPPGSAALRSPQNRARKLPELKGLP
jgi:hypothetical protein